MKFLFSNNTQTAKEELKDALGYIDANIKFDNIRQDILSASLELIDIIGIEAYNTVCDLYTNSPTIDYESEDFLTIKLFRYPIAVNAYRKYAPSNDLAHTNSGRINRVEEGEKAPFEWMIDKDNQAHERRYYQALDQMLNYLNNLQSVGLKEKWQASDQYKQSQSLFVKNIKDFSEFFPIESSYLLLKLKPGLISCERKEILPRIGVTKYNDLKSKFLEQTEISEDDLPLVTLVREACVAYAMAWAIPRMSIQLLPDAIVQNFTSDRSGSRASLPPAKSEAEAARQAFAQTFMRAIADIEDLLKPLPQNTDEIKTNPTIITGSTYLST